MEYQLAVDLLLRLPTALGQARSAADHDGDFHWFAYVRYFWAPRMFRSIHRVWEVGYYDEALCLVRQALEVLASLRYFARHRDRLRVHLTAIKRRERVHFKTMFEEFSPGFYDKIYGPILSGVAHGGLPYGLAGVELDSRKATPPLPRPFFDERHARIVANTTTAALLGFLARVEEFFANYPQLAGVLEDQRRTRMAYFERWVALVWDGTDVLDLYRRLIGPTGSVSSPSA